MEGLRQILAGILGAFGMIAPVYGHTPHAGAQVLFVGDMMFDRTVRTKIVQKGGDYIFSCIDPLLQSEDIVVGNLEGPITASASVSATSTPGDEFNYTFTFPIMTAKLLAAHNIRAVNIGNNHILNFSFAGEKSTKQYLKAAGVDYFGDPTTLTVAHENVRGIKIALINYDQFGLPVPGGLASTTVAQIKAARKAGEIPVVYTHWGDEYLPETEFEKNLAHRFIDAGAEMVIGSHPHVVQDAEQYKGKYIYYSLGNFIFDQYMDDSVMHGLTIEVQFTREGVASVQEIPVELGHDRRVCQL
jgi:poly-gamma-glutamate synthesis protein (capsule biosynthesis protein)